MSAKTINGRSTRRADRDGSVMMLRTILAASLAALALASAGAPAHAHHSIRAAFDPDCVMEFRGAVTRVEWYNPHAWFYVDVVDEAGETVNWGFELGSPNGLARRGWRRDTLKAGDRVVVSGYCARDGGARAAASKVTLADGTELFSGQQAE